MSLLNGHFKHKIALDSGLKISKQKPSSLQFHPMLVTSENLQKHIWIVKWAVDTTGQFLIF